MVDSNAMERYVSALTHSYELMTEAAKKANERGFTVGKRFLDDVTTGHREAADLSKRLAGGAEQAALVYPAIMAAALSAQARALTFAQLMTEASSTASEESTELMERLTEITREVAESTSELVRAWSAGNPLTEMAQRGMAAFARGAGGERPS